MYSGAQAAQLTWPKCNHSILTSPPWDNKPFLESHDFPSLFENTNTAGKYLSSLLYRRLGLFVIAVCCQLCLEKLKQLMMHFHLQHSRLPFLVRRWLLHEENKQCWSHFVHDLASHTQWSVCCCNPDWECSGECGCTVNETVLTALYAHVETLQHMWGERQQISGRFNSYVKMEILHVTLFYFHVRRLHISLNSIIFHPLEKFWFPNNKSLISHLITGSSIVESYCDLWS